MKHLFYVMLTIVLALGLQACKDKKPQGPQPTDFEQALTNEDSMKVAQLVDQFFNYAENRQYDEAAAMLYRLDPKNPKNTPEVLTNEAMDSVKAMLKSIPIVGHTIEYMKFSESNNNEVLCNIIMVKGHDNVPDATTKFFLLPINYLGEWHLCLTDSNSGLSTIVDPNKRDSMQLEYETEKRMKQETEKRPKAANAFKD